MTTKTAFMVGQMILCIVLSSAGAAAVNRPEAPWPPPAGQLRLILDTDAANEIDDQYALALILGTPDRFHLEGIIAANFGVTGGVGGISKSYAEIQTELEKAGMQGKFPVLRGSDPLVYRDQKILGEGVDFIIARAHAATPEDPLWLVSIGPATDAAAALLKDPSIADRIVISWHNRNQWPVSASGFNAMNDILAVRLLFELPCRFVYFDTGAYLRIDPEESARRFGSMGPLGAYLQELRHRKPAFMSPKKGMFDMADPASLADPSAMRWEKTDAPAVMPDLRYDFSKNNGEIVRVYHIETEPAFQLLENALRRIQAMSGRQ